MLTVGSLFSGIGGFDRAFETVGWKTMWHSEIDEYACKVYHRHFPESRCIGDIKTFTWALEKARCRGVCFCGRDVRIGDESCPDCEVRRCLTPEFVARLSEPIDSTEIANAIWGGQPLLAGWAEGNRRSTKQDRESGDVRQNPTPRHLREVWQAAATVQGWTDGDSSPPQRLYEAVRSALALPAVPPPGAHECCLVEEILGNPHAVKVDLICGGFP